MPPPFKINIVFKARGVEAIVKSPLVHRWCLLDVYPSIVLGILELCIGIIDFLLWLVLLSAITKWNPLHQVLEGSYELNNLSPRPSSNRTHEILGES
jgi:hypothetical protein